MHQIRTVGKAIFRKDINRAVARLARAKKLNTTKRNIDGHGALEMDVRGELRESNARKILAQEVMKRKFGLKGFTRLVANESVARRLIRLKKFQARKAKKNAKFD